MVEMSKTGDQGSEHLTYRKDVSAQARWVVKRSGLPPLFKL